MSKKPLSSKTKAPSTAIPTDPNALRKLKISLAIIIGVFAFLLYAQSIAFDYTLDDHPVTNENKFTTKGIAGIPTLIKTDYWYGYSEEYRGPVYRPTSLVMFAIEWQFFPNNPHINHLVNVLLFATTCYVLFLLLNELFSSYNLVFPFVCSLLFASHPIHTEVIDSIKSRDEILCFLFGILAIFFTIKSISNKSNLNLFIAAIFFLLSTLSKETGITFLVIIPLTIYIFSSITIRRLSLVSFVLLITASIYFIIRYQVMYSIETNTATTNLFNSIVAAPDFISREATAFFVLQRYLLLLIFPHPLTFDYNFAMIPVQTLSNLPAIIGILINFSLGIYAIAKVKSKSIIAFGILFYFITLSPVSNIFLLNGATMAERFLYTPSLGFCIIITYLFVKYFNRKVSPKKYLNLSDFFSGNSSLFILIFILIGAYSLKTFSRSMDWKDNYTIFNHDVNTSENSATVHYFLGMELYKSIYNKEKDESKRSKIIDRAIMELNKSINIKPTDGSYRILVACYGTKKDLEEYEITLKAYHDYVLANKFADTFDYRNLSETYYNLGFQYNQTNQFAKSLNIFDSAIKYHPDFSLAYNNKGVALLELGMNQEAIEACEKAVAIDPKNHNAYTNIGCAYTNLKQYEKALEYLNKSIAIDSTDYYPVYIMGVTYQLMGDKIKAQQYLDKANKINGAQQK